MNYTAFFKSSNGMISSKKFEATYREAVKLAHDFCIEWLKSINCNEGSYCFDPMRVVVINLDEESRSGIKLEKIVHPVIGKAYRVKEITGILNGDDIPLELRKGSYYYKDGEYLRLHVSQSDSINSTVFNSLIGFCLRVDDVITPDKFNDLMSFIDMCSERLKQCFLVRDELRKHWKGTIFIDF